VADNWHRRISVLSSGGEVIGTVEGCLPIDPNAEGRPETAAEGQVGGWRVTGDIDPVGQTHFARFVSYANPERGIPQMVEVFDVASLAGIAVAISPAGDRWRRFTTAAIRGRKVVFANMFDGTVRWAMLPSEVFARFEGGDTAGGDRKRDGRDPPVRAPPNPADRAPRGSRPPLPGAG
jgi:hypothetical protein